MATHHDPTRPVKGINGADPFVIAMAKAGGPEWSVVSEEHPGNTEARKIPFVCRAEGVACLSFQEMMLAEGGSSADLPFTQDSSACAPKGEPAPAKGRP
jgi:hypothetical protein